MCFKTRCLFIGLAWFILALALLLWLSGCAHQPLEWTSGEKAALGAIGVLQAADVYQTGKATTTEGYKEGNPLLSSVFGDEVTYGEATASKVIMLTPLIYLVIHRMPRTHKTRRVMLGILGSISFTTVMVNEYTAGGIIFGGDF